METGLTKSQISNQTVDSRVQVGFSREKIESKVQLEHPIFESHELNSYQESLKAVCEEICSFNLFSDGWDGDGSLSPTKESISDAILFVNNWTNASIIPEPEMVFEGSVALQFYDKYGDSKGGIEFRKGHLAVFAIFNKDNRYEKGRFNSGSISDIKGAVKQIEEVLMNGTNR